MTAGTLRRAQARYEAALQRAASVEAARDATIVRALREGMTQRQVASVMGLSNGRIGQIATKARQQ